MARRSSFLSLIAVLCACQRNATTRVTGADGTVADITAADLRRRVEAITDDSTMGRESGSEGDFKAAEMIAAEFRRLGLRPAGDRGTYFQTVPLWTVAVDRESKLVLDGHTFSSPRDFVPAASPITVRTFDGVQTVFGGVVGDPSHWISQDSARGKFIVLLLPKGSAIRGTPVTSARWAGAAGVGLVGLELFSPEQSARLTEGRPVSAPTLNGTGLTVLWLSRSVGDAVIGRPLESVAPGTFGRAVSGRVGFVSKPVAFPARNVVAILPGRDPQLAGQYIALTAHNDHVGFDHRPVDHDSIRAFDRVVRPMGADTPTREPSAEEWGRIRAIVDSARRLRPARLDSIRNGADDDGSGTASILEIAESMARGERPRRSILFVSHVGEEAGLLGSAWYTDHPTVPLDSIVAELDQDMVGRGLPDDYPRGADGPAATPRYLEVVGDQKLSHGFSDVMDAVNARQPIPFVFDRSLAAPGHPLQYYCRADHYNYARYGIPAAAFSRGEHLDYHQVTDEARYISYADLARVSRLIHDAAMEIGNADRRLALDNPKPADPHAPCRQ